jgi:hypothetical protein
MYEVKKRALIRYLITLLKDDSHALPAVRKTDLLKAKCLFLFTLYVISTAPKDCGIREQKKGRAAAPAQDAAPTLQAEIGKKNSVAQLHPPGVEPEPIAWKAIILPLDQECFDDISRKLIKILIYGKMPDVCEKG